MALQPENQRSAAWNAREAALVGILGPTDGMVLHAVLTFCLGGSADVLRFRTHLPGCVAASCELLDEPSQGSTSLGKYESMIAHRDENRWGPEFIARLARYMCVETERGRT